MRKVDQKTRKSNYSWLAFVVLIMLFYISTPYITGLSPNGIMDAVSGALFAVALIYTALALPRLLGAPLAAAIVIAALVFNISNRYYYDLQQTFLSVHTLYLAEESLALLQALPSLALLGGCILSVLLFVALIYLARLAQPTSRAIKFTVGPIFLALSITLQVGYASITDERKLRPGDTSPIGHMARSTGYVPFVDINIEIAALNERTALVNRLSKYPSAKLPIKFSTQRMGKLLGHGETYPHRVSDVKFPFYKINPPVSKPANPSNTDTKNVLLLVLESVRASEMGVYGAIESATPFLDSLAKANVFAEKFYATTNFTVKSEHAIHCSSLDFMIGEPLSKRKLPVKSHCLPQRITEEGYRTMWFHGNTKTFYKRDAYLPKIGFNEIYSRDELDPDNSAPILGWGLPDPLLFDTVLDKLEASDEPFYAEVLSVSNHLPFNYDWNIDFPEHLQSTDTMFDRYRRGIYYTDQAVKGFYERFSESELANNTVLVITGDHGIWTFSDEAQSGLTKNEQFFRVPFIMVTPDKQQQSISDIASHLDIAPTLTQMLNLTGNDDYMGQSLLNPGLHINDRIIYQMTEQALSYRYQDMACIPSFQCQGGGNCYFQNTENTPIAMCYQLDADQDLLVNPIARKVERSQEELYEDRALFDYSQIALNIGTYPNSGKPNLKAAQPK